MSIFIQNAAATRTITIFHLWAIFVHIVAHNKPQHNMCTLMLPAVSSNITTRSYQQYQKNIRRMRASLQKRTARTLAPFNITRFMVFLQCKSGFLCTLSGSVIFFSIYIYKERSERLRFVQHVCCCCEVAFMLCNI